jgi:SOS response regulatory protein OraA/RecX
MNEKNTLMKHAAALIARRSHSRGEMRRKLTAYKAEEDKEIKELENIGEIETVLDRLEHLNLLNDAEYAYNFVFYRTKDLGWGEEKVRKALLDRDVATTVADRALERVLEEITPDGANDALLEYVSDYCRKHGTPSTLKDAQKLARHLAGRGFDEDRIIDAVTRVFPHFGTGD